MNLEYFNFNFSRDIKYKEKSDSLKSIKLEAISNPFNLSFSREAILTFILFPILVVIAYAADKQWLNALFCQKTETVSDKQRQIELGTFAPGEESTYRTDFFIFSFRFFRGTPSTIRCVVCGFCS